MECKWMGYDCRKMKFEEHEAIIVSPKEETALGYLAVKTEYWDAFPEALELPLLEKGFHLCFLANENRWGTDQDLDRKARFIRFVQNEWNLKPKCVLIGMSCGGLFAVKMAARYPEMVGCMYLDAPVINYMSCPCGFGRGIRLNENHEEIMKALDIKTIGQLLAYRDMPLDKLDVLVKNRIPAVLVSGDCDQSVPYEENGILLEEAYRDAGIEIEVFIKPGGDHHPHGLPDPGPLVEFVLKQMERGNGGRRCDKRMF